MKIFFIIVMLACLGFAGYLGLMTVMSKGMSNRPKSTVETIDSTQYRREQARELKEQQERLLEQRKRQMDFRRSF